MKTILVGATEIVVLNVYSYTYDYGRGEKVLRVEVDENTASFETLKELLSGNEEPIQYYEDGALKCEYVGYNKFEAQYTDGVYKVELHLASVESQMIMLLAANERMSAENAEIKVANTNLANAVSNLQQENAQIKEENSELSDAVAGLQQENATLKEQIYNIEVSGSGEADEIINAMLGLEE